MEPLAKANIILGISSPNLSFQHTWPSPNIKIKKKKKHFL